MFLCVDPIKTGIKWQNNDVDLNGCTNTQTKRGTPSHEQMNESTNCLDSAWAHWYWFDGDNYIDNTNIGNNNDNGGKTMTKRLQ